MPQIKSLLRFIICYNGLIHLGVLLFTNTINRSENSPLHLPAHGTYKNHSAS